ncbi:Hsp70 family protein [Nisaea acidiphila]|uniref:Hsp70 family protein n=1 Tax=Nisaea acidiphila TaxID=1862145 RepID=A0A9J7AWQ9_9PROT|nr:Hsp70 family protein [Nisaea acidiphila]UUX49877.1 Hsp70 family protein [Nisaea acidiphila]
MRTDTLAIDFGTSNSAAAIWSGNSVRRLPIEDGSETLPTAVFFPLDGRGMQIGSTAAEALTSGEEGRYMRALKSVLGQPLLHEPRTLGGKRRTLAEIIAAFLAELKHRAEAQTGQSFTRVLSGRPVHFHTSDPEKDAQAEADLRACYAAAGFEEIAFLAEPEAAAIASHGMGAADETGLIVDIGGGTSDFTVFRSKGAHPEILASHGIRLGGTDFDHAVSMQHAMPLLGLGGELRRDFGDGLLPVPNTIYSELATWATIPFLYNAKTRRMVTDMARLAVEREKIERLGAVLDQHLGHELAFAVERGKIDANGADRDGRIGMEFIESGLGATVTPESLDAALSANRSLLRGAAAETLEMAGIGAGEIGHVILVGGSSLMRFVSTEIRALCPQAEILAAEAFTAVVDGLALATRR